MKRVMIPAIMICFGLGATFAWGDATIESTFKTGGFKGMGASEGTTVRRYQGEKMWESMSSKFTGAVLSRIAGGSETVSITRVDKGVSWQLDPKKKAYAEHPIKPLDRKEFQEGKRDPGKKPKIRITKSEFTVKKTGATETIHGFPCEEYRVTWYMEMEDLETQEKSKSTMVNDQWTTPETATIRRARADETAFQKAYAQKLGIHFSPDEAKQAGMSAAASLTGASPEEIEKGWAQVKKEMAKIKGYPIRTTVTWKFEGASARKAGQEEGPSETGSGPTAEVGKLIGGLLGKFGAKKRRRRRQRENPRRPRFSPAPRR
jgi:hypothetical protein